MLRLQMQGDKGTGDEMKELKLWQIILIGIVGIAIVLLILDGAMLIGDYTKAECDKLNGTFSVQSVIKGTGDCVKPTYFCVDIKNNTCNEWDKSGFVIKIKKVTK